MFGRYRRLVPKAQRDLIREHSLPKPNWFVGSAEAGRIEDVRMDAALLAEIDRARSKVDARLASEPTRDEERAG